MKHIIAYIRPNKLPAVTLALHRLPSLPGMSFSEVRGFSSDRLPKSDPPIVQDLIDYSPYVRIEVFCGDLRSQIHHRNGRPHGKQRRRQNLCHSSGRGHPHPDI